VKGLELDRAAVLAALADARWLGCRLATLVSTPAARRLYERLGFGASATLG
jgi:ribosomal protein S18 acetylase RimI-like enzyme